MTITSPELTGTATETGTAEAPARKDGYLFGPWADFFGLGGGSIIPLLILAFLVPKSLRGEVALVSLVVANFINHPHFGHSYQIFYKDFSAKLSGENYSTELQRRYLISGIIVPVALLGFFAATLFAEAPRVMGQGVNLMAFLVGWHYVKQGYGMLIVDSVMKKRFFDDRAKKVLLWNAYANWAMTYVLLNNAISERTPEYWGVEYVAFTFSDIITMVTAVVSILTTAATVVVLVQHRQAGKQLPVNGLVAYAVSIYLWRLLPLNTLGGLLVPAFHSLQYLTVVWRYQLNAEHDTEAVVAGTTPRQRFRNFILKGSVLGALGFWILPFTLSVVMPYNRELFGGAMFLFVFWIGINVHHYFLDTVIWRRANPDTKRYLFS